MYKAFFGLTERPFSKTPDPKYLYLSKGHREALARLQHAVEERDIILLTGAIGCGKTTLSRALMDELDSGFQVILLTNPRLSPLEFLRTLAFRLDIVKPAEYKSELLEQLGERLYQLYRESIHPVLIIDEAQLIPHKDTFDEIRLLTNFQLDDGNLISVVLMGQPELRSRLAHPVYEPLRQRIGIHFALGPLSESEIGAYLEYRILCAGGTGDIFQQDAVSAIARFTGGTPRKINQVAALALLEGFGRDCSRIDAKIVAAVVEELSEL
ncbi:MAG: ATPase [Desulfuromonas sp.]|jgi:type II secretory pathway predicted ATPase ExeA|nr:MAG: ATPase [Desulfuromonas sp.]